MRQNYFFRTVLVSLFALVSLSSFGQKIVWNASGGSSPKMMDFKNYCLRILPEGVRMQNVYSDGSFGPGNFSPYFNWVKVLKDTKGIEESQIAGYQMHWNRNRLAYFVVCTNGKMYNVTADNAYALITSNEIPRDKWTKSYHKTSHQIVPKLRYMTWVKEVTNLELVGL